MKLLSTHLRLWAQLAEEIEAAVITDDPARFQLLWDLNVSNHNIPVTVARVEIARLVRTSTLLLAMSGHNNYKAGDSTYEILALVEVVIEAGGKIRLMSYGFTIESKIAGDEAKKFIIKTLSEATKSHE